MDGSKFLPSGGGESRELGCSNTFLDSVAVVFPRVTSPGSCLATKYVVMCNTKYYHDMMIFVNKSINYVGLTSPKRKKKKQE